MTRRSLYVDVLDAKQRQQFHDQLQKQHGHWMPDGTKPRPGNSYRAARRNIARRARV